MGTAWARPATGPPMHSFFCIPCLRSFEMQRAEPHIASAGFRAGIKPSISSLRRLILRLTIILLRASQTS
eukprot:864616-Pelagomonas_calceolata.AAC.1